MAQAKALEVTDARQGERGLRQGNAAVFVRRWPVPALRQAARVWRRWSILAHARLMDPPLESGTLPLKDRRSSVLRLPKCKGPAAAVIRHQRT